MKLKSNIKLTGIRPELLIGIMVCDSVYTGMGYEMTITSVTDGKHSRTSLHYSGCAFDLRIKDLKKKDVQPIFKMIREKLTIDFDVILESTHIHVEYQPRYKQS